MRTYIYGVRIERYLIALRILLVTQGCDQMEALYVCSGPECRIAASS